MVDWDFLFALTREISEIGKEKREIPLLHLVEPFKHFFTKDGKLNVNELDEYDGKWTRREILARYLLVNVVLNQGPDVTGIRDLLKNVTTDLYRREIRIFHRPIDFFRELGISIDEILEKHESIKKIRAEEWAKENKSSPSKYNLFFAQSMRGMISTKQVLDYAVHRWGVPLCLPLLLERDLEKSERLTPQPLIDYLENWPSAEIMTQQLKENERFGLGSAIGDKACHLYAKMYVSIFNLVKHKTGDPGWTDISYEVPFDSNAGRVLFRTGFLLEAARIEDYKDWEVIQPGKGKGGLDYIRVTNIRGQRSPYISQDSEMFQDYIMIVSQYLKVGQRPQSVEIQKIPNLVIHKLSQTKLAYSVADFDDGLMFIGTTFCFNHENPRCSECPVRSLCKGYNEDKTLIKDYRT